MIREDKTYQLELVMQTGKKEGMHTMNNSLQQLYLQGIISREETVKKASDEQVFINSLI